MRRCRTAPNRRHARHVVRHRVGAVRRAEPCGGGDRDRKGQRSRPRRRSQRAERRTREFRTSVTKRDRENDEQPRGHERTASQQMEGAEDFRQKRRRWRRRKQQREGERGATSILQTRQGVTAVRALDKFGPPCLQISDSGIEYPLDKATRDANTDARRGESQALQLQGSHRATHFLTFGLGFYSSLPFVAPGVRRTFSG